MLHHSTLLVTLGLLVTVGAYAENPEPILQMKHPLLATVVAFSEDGTRLASAGTDNTIRIWEIPSGKRVITLRGHWREVNSVAFSPDGKVLASGSADKTLRIWDSRTGQELYTSGMQPSAIHSVAFSPDGKWLAAGSSDSTIKLWDVTSRKEVRILHGPLQLPLGSSPASVAFSPDGRSVAGGSDIAFNLGDRGYLTIWDINSGKELRTLHVHVSVIAYSPDGKLLSSAGSENWADRGSEEGHVIKVWDANDGRLLYTLKGHTASVIAVAFSPDGRWLASGGGDETLKLWDIASGNAVRSIGGFDNRVFSVAFSPNGKWLATASPFGVIKVWEVSRLQ